MVVTVLIADGDPSFRDRVRRFLGESVSIVGEAETGDEAVRLALEREPDVVIMDVGIRDVDGIAATRRIKQERSQTRVILLTVHDEEAYLSATGKSGADVLLPKRRIRTELLSAIRTTASRLLAFWNGLERRERTALPSEALDWDGMERRRRLPDGSNGPMGAGHEGSSGA